MATTYKYIYGPVSSWRLGRSLGIDPLSAQRKICSFDCIYCQIGKAAPVAQKRKRFVSTKKLIKEINSLPPLRIDYITFSGRGEPTLAENLGQMIKTVKKARNEKIAILTNASLINRKDVRRDLLLADFVVVKLDASSQALFGEINRPAPGLKLKKVIKGIKEFKAKYRGKLALQIMFVRENKKYVKEIADIAREINPDEVQINTPLRPCGTVALSRKDIDSIKSYFKGMNLVSVYNAKRKKVKPISRRETLRRRGKI